MFSSTPPGVQLLAHGAEGEHVQPLVVNGARRQVLAAVLAVIAAGHEMHVNRFHVARNPERRVEFQRAAGAGPGHQFLAGGVQAFALLLHAVHHHVPHHLLGSAARRGIGLEDSPLANGAMHACAVHRPGTRFILHPGGNAGVEVLAHGAGKIVKDVAAQAGNEPFPRPCVPAAVQGQRMANRLGHGSILA